MTLTNEQLKPVNSDCRINVALAVPGSGKTTVLVARAERLWNEFKERILIITFSKKATEEIIRRISPANRVSMDIKTIHSFCYDIVKEYWQDIGDILGSENWPREAALVTKDQEIKLIQELFKTVPCIKFYETVESLRKFQLSPETLKRMYIQGAYLGKFKLSELELFCTYERERIARGLITFDDMVNLAEILVSLPHISVEISRKYEHILIDEAQDTSDSQWKILRPLVITATTTLVVGDYNQAIYNWRAADGSILVNTCSMKDSVIFRLSQSFRSGSVLTKLANMIVYDKSSQIVSNKVGGSVEIHAFNNADEESDWVLEHMEPNTAIISRTNSYLELFETKAIHKGVQYGGNAFYRAYHIKDLYNFLKNYSGADIKAVITKAYIQNDTYTRHQKDDFKLVLERIEKFGPEYFYYLVEKSAELDGEGFTLITGHSAKGLEWDNVVVVGCHTGHVPHKASNDDREEKNIFYVMTTRSKESLKITCVGEPSVYIPKEYK